MASVYHLLNRQIPAHIREQYPVFCKFIEYYYRWLQTRGFDKLEKVTNIDYECQAISIKDCFDKNDQSIDSSLFANRFIGYTVINEQGAIAEIVGCDQSKIIIRYLTQDGSFGLNDRLYIRQNTSVAYDPNRKYDRANVSQIHTLPSAFIEHFSSLLDTDNIFDTNNANIALILKHIKQLYQSKGTEQALKYILKATKNVDAEVKYPWKQVLKPSDGKWQRQYAVNIKVSDESWYDIPKDINRVYLEVLSNDPLHPESTYIEKDIVKIEIFGRQSENYDNEDWWKRDNDSADGSLDSSKIELDEQGNIKFFGSYPDGYPDGYPNTYGRFARYIDSQGESKDHFYTPFIRLYFEDDPQVFENQLIRVAEYDPITGEQIKTRALGKVTLGVNGVKIIKPGRKWQVGQIFTANREKLWELYTEPSKQIETIDGKQVEISNSITVNDRGVLLQYSTDVPFIGRVSAVDEQGGIVGIEIVQLGDHLPHNAGKTIVASPLYNKELDRDEYQAELELLYGAQTRVLGRFADNSGMLSDNDIRLQDNYYYQKFSYDIVANADPKTYVDMASKLHPVGTKMFTTYTLEADLDNSVDTEILPSDMLLRISLFDIAIVADKLTKKVRKPLHDDVIVEELVAMTTIKRLKDIATVNDCYDRTYTRVLDISYDDRSLNYVERTFDYENNVSTSYCDTGIITDVMINYNIQRDPS